MDAVGSELLTEEDHDSTLDVSGELEEKTHLIIPEDESFSSSEKCKDSKMAASMPGNIPLKKQAIAQDSGGTIADTANPTKLESDDAYDNEKAVAEREVCKKEKSIEPEVLASIAEEGSTNNGKSKENILSAGTSNGKQEKSKSYVENQEEKKDQDFKSCQEIVFKFYSKSLNSTIKYKKFKRFIEDSGLTIAFKENLNSLTQIFDKCSTKGRMSYHEFQQAVEMVGDLIAEELVVEKMLSLQSKIKSGELKAKSRMYMKK